MNLDLGNLPRTIWVEKSEGGPVVGFGTSGFAR